MGASQVEVAFTNPGPLGAGPSHLERKHRARFRGLIVNGLSAMLTDMLKSARHTPSSPAAIRLWEATKELLA